MSESNLIKVGITQGDYNGISYEVIMKTFMDHGMMELCTPIVYGAHKAASFWRKQLNIQDFSFYGVPDVDKAVKHHCNFLSVFDGEVNVEPGVLNKEAGEIAFKSLEKAVEDLIAGKIDVLVTAPINKKSIQNESFKHPGHTEYLAEKTNSKDYLMLLISDELRIGTLTGHLPVSNVANAINGDRIFSKLQLLHKSLITDFGVRKPKIAVLGLNPHAGDDGLIGKEEQDIILPAIQKAKEANILVFGPYSADGFFGSATFRQFDAVLAMYHDQGLIPFKTLAFHHGVNYTAGLPVVRTSPDHGTGFDIAGKNIASADSLREAIFKGIDIFRKREEYAELSANPLKFSKKDKERY
ncbi:MAG: 4-hydroxythreonine-4-phosphate dehydrogenase PdxA [Flavobacteriales bacterium]